MIAWSGNSLLAIDHEANLPVDDIEQLGLASVVVRRGTGPNWNKAFDETELVQCLGWKGKELHKYVEYFIGARAIQHFNPPWAITASDLTLLALIKSVKSIDCMIAIRMANLSSFDMNLLRVLDALLIERSTVRAGARLGLSQPAVSGALKRLRLSLDDELFFRSGQKLEATAFALSLIEPLQDILHSVEALIGPRDAFDPATAEHSFRISGSDFFAEMLMPALAEHLAAHAPSLRVHLVNFVPDNGVDTLASHDLDFILLPKTPLPDWAEAEPVLSAPFSVIAKEAHPRTKEFGLASGDVMPLDLFCELGHVLFSTEGKPQGLGDEALARVGRERRVVMTLPVFSGVYRAVAGSDLIALLPTVLAHRVAKSENLAVFRPPIHVDLVRLDLIWPRRFSESPPHLWLKRQIVELLRPMDTKCA